MKILSRPKGNAEEYGRWSVNPYLGCRNNCSYCYLKSGPGAKTLGGNVPTLKKGVVNENHAYHLAMAEIIENREEILRDGGLFMTFTSDPMHHDTRKLFARIAEESIYYNIPVTILTKCSDFYDLGCEQDDFPCELDWMVQNSEKTHLLAFGFTLTGHNELEPNAAPNMERIKTMKVLHNDHFHVWASIEPIIDFDSSYNMIQQALDAGCGHFKIGLLTKNTKPCSDMYDIDDCVDFITKVMMLTRDKATVYWKQSVRDFIRTSRKPTLTNDELRKVFDSWPNSVGKDFSMFTSNNYGK